MEHETKRSHDECYYFPAFRSFLKKYKSLAVKSLHDHAHNRTAFQRETSKVTHNNNQDGNHVSTKKVSQNGNGVEELNKMGNMHVHNDSHNDHHTGCFRTIILLSAPRKKHVPSKVSASDLSNTASMERFQKIPSRTRSFGTTPSLGRSGSINNSRSEQYMKTPNTSRVASMNRTMSAGSRTTSSFNGRNGSFVKKSTSIGRSRSDMASFRGISISRSGPIMFSNSSGVLKPPPMEQQLECTLEELYHGCVKHIKVSRDVYTSTRRIIQEEEVLTVNVKPGWKTGTKITFEGTTKDEKPGEYPGDVIFIITEKHHPLFRRNDDNLELEIEIPLVDALTGCTLTIPLLGTGKLSMSIDDIVHPGYEKIIVGQGMPNQKNPNHKGNLKVKFLVDFPMSLTDEQRSGIFRIFSGYFD